jgi:iron(III) transport system ATP-binding protein
MHALTIDGISKNFAAASGHRIQALDRVSLSIDAGELVAVLGASGCGKSTLLRMVAGFETADAGTIRLGDRLLTGPATHVPPEARKVGIVFQSYALWPHMDVAGNVGYALAVAGLDKATIRTRVAAALESVDLAGFETRKPAELSGGQRQRVALARCLAMDPALVLLDEPLANLDIHLRASMLESFASFHAKTEATMLYVTHDQAEAMALADRIAVLEAGRLLQFADPRTLYREPDNEAVARFVGRGMVVGAHMTANENGAAQVEIFGASVRVRASAACAPGPRKLVLRAENLAPAADGFGVRVTHAAYIGGAWEIAAVPLAEPDTNLRAVLGDGPRPQPGDTLNLAPKDGWVLPG